MSSGKRFVNNELENFWKESVLADLKRLKPEEVPRETSARRAGPWADFESQISQGLSRSAAHTTASSDEVILRLTLR
jgi:hypothetical protein